MKLSKAMKEAIIRAIVADLPRVDHNALAHNLVQEAMFARLPQAIKDIANNKEIAHHLENTHIHLPSPLNSLYVVGRPIRDENWIRMSGIDDAVLVKSIQDIAGAAEKQNNTQTQLKNSLERSFAAINTLKQAKQVYPEFAKYYPAETIQERQMPVATGILAELTEAGWPKDKVAA